MDLKHVNPWLAYSAAKTDTEPANVYLYGRVGKDWWGDGNAAKEFGQLLDELSPRDINLYVNSEGGDVFEGYAMYAHLLRYPGTVTAYVDGLAASAASYIILAAGEVVMGPVAQLMIHNAWSLAIGNAAEMREVAERLDAIDAQILGIYEGRSNRTREELAEAMLAETWLDSETALEWGFVDRVEEGLQAAACLSDEARAAFRHAPEALTADTPDTEEPVANDAADTITDTETVEESAEQELKPVEAQERVRLVALSSGIYKFTEKE